MQYGEWRINSFSDPGKQYNVILFDGRFRCSCPHHAKTGKTCKHITKIKQDLGDVKPDSSGYKSAVQKAIRRNDLPLLKLAFSFLWEKERSWLLWRMPVLAGEEVWHSIGLVDEAVEEARKIMKEDEPKAREIVWRSLQFLAVQVKAKDADGLKETVMQLEQIPELDRIRIIRKLPDDKRAEMESYLAILPTVKEALKAKASFNGFWNSDSPDKTYLNKFVAGCRRRFYAGGTIDDRLMMIAAVVLARRRNIDDQRYQPCIFKPENEIEACEKLPWWSMDMHTAVGKRAYYIMCRDHDPQLLEHIWFYYESGLTDEQDESYWYEQSQRIFLHRYGISREDAIKEWEKIEPQVAELVQKFAR